MGVHGRCTEGVIDGRTGVSTGGVLVMFSAQRVINNAVSHTVYSSGSQAFFGPFSPYFRVSIVNPVSKTVDLKVHSHYYGTLCSKTSCYL